MLVYSKSEIIKTLKKSMNEIKILSDKQISNKCKTCALFNVHGLISRFIEKLEHFNFFFIESFMILCNSSLS